MGVWKGIVANVRERERERKEGVGVTKKKVEEG